MTRPLFSWRHAICKSGLPPTTRHVLLTLSVHMNDAGESCFPSVRRLAAETGLSERAVCTHIKRARESGWLQVDVHGFGGQKWKRHEYTVSVPADFEVGPVARKGTEPGSTPSKKALNLTPKGTEPDDAKALNNVQSSSSVNTTTNTTKANARKSAPAHAKRFEEFWQVYPKHREKKRAREIWARKRLDDRADELIADVEKRKRADGQWLQGFVPHPSTYLNGERWDDEMSDPPAAGPAGGASPGGAIWSDLLVILTKGRAAKVEWIEQQPEAVKRAVRAAGGIGPLGMMSNYDLRAAKGVFIDALKSETQKGGKN